MIASPFIAAWLSRLASELGPRTRALDLAMGSGRHTTLLARYGFKAFGVDRDAGLVAAARADAQRQGVSVAVWVTDLTTAPLPLEAFDVLVVTRYLDRDRWSDFLGTVRPGGYVLYETFTTRQLAYGTGPRSPGHLLRPGELREALAAWKIELYEEDEGPPALARIAARRQA